MSMSLEPGTYTARCIDAQLGETKKGTPQIVLEFEVVGDNAWAGSRITAYCFLTEAAMDRSLESLRYCGWRGADLSDLSGVMDNDVELVVKDETYEGKTFPRVQWINRPGGKSGGARAPLAADKAAAVNQRIRARLAVVDQKIKAQKPAAGGPNDEPPF